MDIKDNNDKQIVHLVFFWLKNPTIINDRFEFEKSINKLLKTCSYAKNNHLGIPAADIDRPVVDTSYTYCLKLIFKNKLEHDNYQSDSAHRLFISESKHLWEKVQIYDSEEIYFRDNKKLYLT